MRLRVISTFQGASVRKLDNSPPTRVTGERKRPVVRGMVRRPGVAGTSSPDVLRSVGLDQTSRPHGGSDARKGWSPSGALRQLAKAGSLGCMPTCRSPLRRRPSECRSQYRGPELARNI